jgi:hypothetical protein
MAQNTTPGFTKNANITSCLVTAGNTKSDGAGTIGTDIFLAFTAGADGAFVDKLRFILTGTVAATASSITVARVFLSTKAAGATTSADTYLYAEVPLTNQSADNSTVAVTPIDVAFGFRIPAGMTILVTNHVAPQANTAWRALPLGGDY